MAAYGYLSQLTSSEVERNAAFRTSLVTVTTFPGIMQFPNSFPVSGHGLYGEQHGFRYQRLGLSAIQPFSHVIGCPQVPTHGHRCVSANYSKLLLGAAGLWFRWLADSHPCAPRPFR